MKDEQIIQKFSIGIVDDHRLFSQAVKELISSFDFIEEVDLCEPPKECGFQFPRKTFHLILLDISMPHYNGFEVFKQFRISRPHQKIAFLSNKDQLNIRLAKKVKADGYLLKNNGIETFQRALKTILVENKKYFPTLPAEINKGFKHKGSYIKLTQGEQTFLNTLIEEYLKIEQSKKFVQPSTEEQHEILLQSIIDANATRQMFISKRTAQAYLKNLKDKFDALNTAQLLRYAIDAFKYY